MSKPPFYRRTSFAVLASLGLLLSGGLATLTNAMQVSAADMECTGKNVLTALAKERPAAAKAVKEQAAGLPYGSGLLWKVEMEGAKPSYVFGTMHMSDPRLLDLPPKVETALAASRTLALEVTDVLDPQKMKEKAKGLVQFTAYTDGSDITSRLDDAQEKLVSELFSKRGNLPWFLAKKLRPWALMGALATPACETARKAAGKPFLDQMLAQKAEKAGINLVSLETVESQIKAMASLPEPLMITALVETAKVGDQMDDIFETMIQLYESEEVGTVWAMMKHLGPDGVGEEVQDSDYAAFQREIVDKRNVTMADGTEKLIRDGGAAFIAVGALHLPGEKGLLAILAQRGFTVSPL